MVVAGYDHYREAEAQALSQYGPLTPERRAEIRASAEALFLRQIDDAHQFGAGSSARSRGPAGRNRVAEDARPGEARRRGRRRGPEDHRGRRRVRQEALTPAPGPMGAGGTGAACSRGAGREGFMIRSHCVNLPFSTRRKHAGCSAFLLDPNLSGLFVETGKSQDGEGSGGAWRSCPMTNCSARQGHWRLLG